MPDGRRQTVEPIRAADGARPGRHIDQVIAIAVIRGATPDEKRIVVTPRVVGHHAVIEQQPEFGAVGAGAVQARELAEAPLPTMHEHDPRASGE